MGRAAFAFGAPDCGAGVMDGSAREPLSTVCRSTGDSSFGASGTGQVLPGSAIDPGETCPDGIPQAEQELSHLWFDLSAPDRQRFGHCFSFMVLKALGLRPCPAQEVEA